MSSRNLTRQLLGHAQTGVLSFTQKQLGVKKIYIPQLQVRHLSLHEYQSQNLLKQYNIPTPRGKVASTPEKVQEIIEELGGKCMIKSQIQKGGRGKGQFENGLQGGIQMVTNGQEGKQLSMKMLGERLQTKQTGDRGLIVKQVYVAEEVQYSDEWYLAMTIDRENYGPAIILSKNGGVDIEAVAKESPENLFTFPFRISTGITADILEEISSRMKISAEDMSQIESVLRGLYKIFVDKDATLLEINPLARTSEGKFFALDAKFNFDNASEIRQQSLFAERDPTHEVPEESEAEKYGLVYVRMDGNIGNVVNGAGLAMATNDAIGLYGGSSANFLDAGGQATKETMQEAFRIILKDERVKTILVNIYGGIISCAMIAESIIGAASDLGPIRVPVVVRLQGTDSAKGLKMLEEADLGLHVEAEFGEAARKAVMLAKSS